MGDKETNKRHVSSYGRATPCIGVNRFAYLAAEIRQIKSYLTKARCCNIYMCKHWS